ncbi:MAG: prepilin-type N-terminal cleavage/methylation domain-containing protein [Candidatus Poribacteria bacterium]|nr:prepilin-type N-terminal cleavage/methylation domain-containing protein [Candidatus Poribacteria bacterium]
MMKTRGHKGRGFRFTLYALRTLYLPLRGWASFSRSTHHQRGFTLIELLISVSVLVIIGGGAYTSFNIATDIYRKSESQIVMNQKCRIALDRFVTDLSNLQALQGDESLILVSQDNPSEEGAERDVISFVTLVRTDPDPFLAQLNPEGQLGGTDAVEENQPQLVSDVQRVAYYIGEDVNQLDIDSEARGAMLAADSETDQDLVLLRLATTALEPETVIQPLLESGTLPTEDEEGNPIRVDIVPLIDQIVSFDLKYFDGEEWYESWEDTEAIPKSVQVLITVAGENRSADQNAASATMTQSTMVYLMMSVNFSEQPLGGGPGG